MQPSIEALELERACARALGPEFEQPHEESGLDLRKKDGSLGLEIKTALRSLRDFHAAVVAIAKIARQKDAPHRVCLVARMPRLSRKRVAAEWETFRSLLKSDLARKLALVVIDPPDAFAFPPKAHLVALAERLIPVFQAIPDSSASFQPRVPSEKFFEVFKVLLLEWLEGRIPSTMKFLMKATGASYTSVSQSVERLRDSHEIRRRRSRAVELTAFPRTTWREILALLGPLRKTVCYRDASGRSTHPRALYDVVKRKDMSEVAVGGTLAGRQADTCFDLHGMPRLDLSLHTPSGKIPEGFVRGLLPGLRPCASDEAGAILAIHPLRRAWSFFKPDPRKRVRWADKVETLLDLHELGLTQQAEGLIQRFVDKRPRKSNGHP